MERPDREIEILRAMGPAEKLAVMQALIRQAFDIKAAALRSRWPKMSEEEVRSRTRSLVGGDCP